MFTIAGLSLLAIVMIIAIVITAAWNIRNVIMRDKQYQNMVKAERASRNTFRNRKQ